MKWKNTFFMFIFLFNFLATLSAKTWYVQGGASAINSQGTLEHPFYSLAQVQAASGVHDTIYILPSPFVLDGGIILKDGQHLRGQSICHSEEDSDDCCFTNDLVSQITHSSGDAVTLARDNIVSGLHIVNAGGYAIFGHNIQSAEISHNVITGANQLQLLQENFALSTEFRGFIVDRIGNPNFENEFFPRSAIGFMGTFSSQMTLQVKDNIIKGTEERGFILGNYGPGIALLLTDQAQATLYIDKAIIRQTALIPTVIPNYTSGIYLYLSGHAQASVSIENVKINDLAMSNDGMDVVSVEDSQLNVVIRKYQFRGRPEQGQFSQGLEAITTYGRGEFAPVIGEAIRNHTATMILRMEESEITDSASVGFLLCSFLQRSPNSIFDLGGGPKTHVGNFTDKPSRGSNKIYHNSTGAAFNSNIAPFKNLTILNAIVYARKNWWGKGTTVKTRFGLRKLNLEFANVCGVNFSDKLCDSTEPSKLITAPALVKEPRRHHHVD